MSGVESTPLVSLTLCLPSWIAPLLRACGPLPTTAQRMAFVIELARRNVAENTGGPFAAAVVEADSGALVAAAVNMVEPALCSLAHAEMLAIALAQRRLGHFDLAAGGRALQLVTSCEPCAMCFGAIPWSGIRQLVCGALRQDAEAIGFDEGGKPAAWVEELERRGVQVSCGVLRDAAAAVLQEYARLGRPIYNAGTRLRPAAEAGGHPQR